MCRAARGAAGAPRCVLVGIQQTGGAGETRNERSRAHHWAFCFPKSLYRGARVEAGCKALPTGVDRDQRWERSRWQVGGLAWQLRFGIATFGKVLRLVGECCRWRTGMRRESWNRRQLQSVQPKHAII